MNHKCTMLTCWIVVEILHYCKFWSGSRMGCGGQTQPRHTWESLSTDAEQRHPVNNKSTSSQAPPWWPPRPSVGPSWPTWAGAPSTWSDIWESSVSSSPLSASSSSSSSCWCACARGRRARQQAISSQKFWQVLSWKYLRHIDIETFKTSWNTIVSLTFISLPGHILWPRCSQDYSRVFSWKEHHAPIAWWSR